MTENAIVAIPARDEAERIGSCLDALNSQRRCPDVVVLLLNNCADQTEAVAATLQPKLRFRLHVVNRDLPPPQANAGHARRLAMQIAADHAGRNGVLLTTDADAIVPPDWVSRNIDALRVGADVVCGRAVIDPAEAALIPAHLHEDDARECRLIALLDALAWMLDREPHDPQPRHTEASGASLAVRADAFWRVGGIPDIQSGEDRAFVRALWMMDLRVRHDPAMEVTVSGRVVGRAEGGMAGAIRRRMVQQDEFTDEQVEPALDAFRRYGLRSRIRRAWGGLPDVKLAEELALAKPRLKACLGHQFFGGAWAALEACSPILQRRRVRSVDVPAETLVAEALLRQTAALDTLAAD